MLYDRQIKDKKQIIEENSFPIIVELEALKYNLKKNDSSTDVHSVIMSDNSGHKKYFQVNEEEIEDDQDELSQEQDSKSIQDQNEEANSSKIELDECEESEENDENELDQSPQDNTGRQKFKLKNTKGNVVYDKTTK